MTRRRPSNKKPQGVNRSLGNSLRKDREKTRTDHRIKKFDDADHENAAYLDFNKKVGKNIDSVTEETGLDEFLAKAELAGTEFTAERGNFQILGAPKSCVVPTKKDLSTNLELQKEYAHRLLIPRRPQKDLWETPEELLSLENENFLEWRKGLAELQEVDGLVLTPFERNLELWRQLWRVIERSDIIVQIVDARNPLIFRSTDLEAYVDECGPGKHNVMLINKADLLTDEQVNIWRKWFLENNVDAIFWCAVEPELGSVKEEEIEEDANASGSEDGEGSENGDDVDEGENKEEEEQNVEEKSGGIERSVEDEQQQQCGSAPFLHSPDELISHLKQIGRASSLGDGCRPLVVGMVGYPNVGKSSTINRIMGVKKVSVSATPGKTRHLQTLIVDSQMTLCDCPGLVMPSFAFNRSEMLLNGILSVDHMQEHFTPVGVLASRVPRRFFEKGYSVMLPKPAEHEAKDRAPTSHELLTSVAFMRGFMSSSGIPDCSRAARLILKDVVNGRLKWVAAPPGVEQDDFDLLTYPVNVNDGEERQKGGVVLQQLEKRHLIEGASVADRAVDKQFFAGSQSSAHIRSSKPPAVDGPVMEGGKPVSKKHFKGKKDKLRRIYAD